jgi:site-specific DNA recombinase
MTDNKIQCGLYTRVSTRNQLDTNYTSLDAQKDRLISFVKSRDNYEVYRVYEDGGFTGENVDRPGLQEMLNDVRAGKINCVLTHKMDRLTRSVRDFYTLTELFNNFNVTFISITELFDSSSPAGRLLRNIMVQFAEYEREVIAQRTRDKMQQLAIKGMWKGGVTPFGYKSVDKKLVVHEKESDILKLIFRAFGEHYSLARTRDELELLGITNRKGKPWSKTALDHIVRNPVYVGKVKFNDECYKGEHQALIDQATFDRLQKARRSVLHSKTKISRPFLLKGLVKCGYCGSTMIPHYTQKKHADGSTYYIFYYRCTKTMHYRNEVCQVRHVNASELEKLVVDHLDYLSRNGDYLRTSVEKVNEGFQYQLEPLRQEELLYSRRIAEIDIEAENYVRALGKATISIELLEHAVGKLKSERKDLEERLFVVKQKIQSMQLEGFDAELIQRNLSNFRAVFENLDSRDKPQCIALLLQEAKVYKDRIELNLFDLPEFTGGSQNRQTWRGGRDSNPRPPA